MVTDQVVTEVLIVECDGNRYGLAVDRVAEVIRAVAVSPAPDWPEEVLGLIDLRGDLVRVIDARTLLGLTPAPLHHSHQFVIVRLDQEQIGLHVDRAIDLICVERSDDRPCASERVKPNPGKLKPGLVEFIAKSDHGIVAVLSAEFLVSGGASGSLDRIGNDAIDR